MALFLHLILCASTNAEKLSEFISLESGMTLYAPLDDNAEPLETSGKRPSDAGKVEFAPGVRGNAFLFRDAEGFIDYATKGVVSTDAGTISVWVKPLEWGKSDTHIRHFMTFTAGEQDRGYFCWLYKFFSSPAYFLVWEPDYGRPVLVRSKKGWEQGKWQHFVATWNGNRMGLVVNGEPSPATYTLRQSLLPSLAAKLRLGGRSDPDKRATLLDEFYVFNRELTAAEAKSLFDLDKAGMEESLPARTEVSLPRIESFKLLGLRARQYPGVSRVVAGLDVFRMNKKERQGFSAVLKLEVPGGEVVQEHALPLRRAYIEHAFDTSKLKPGEYLLSAELLNGKKSVERAKVGFTLDPKPEWLANTLGKSPDVIEPWTPVKVEQGTASCWGRRIVWDGRVLPGQIKSQGSDLLAAPMRIVATVAGKETLTTEESFAFVEENPQRTSFEGKARLGTMEVRVKGWMEFDGMIWMTVSVSGPDGARIDRLALEIPMRKKAATLMITNRGIAPGTGSLTPLQT
ncbi:MAG: DUF6067 family protein, partial [Planctomycetota bacterium]|nr:DUF6067 family protein [Planctomycetota bacterium]